MVQQPTPAATTKSSTGNTDQTALTLATLLQLEKDVRHASSPQAFRFIVVNETRRLVHYDQAVLWRRLPGSQIRIEAVSGVADISREAPYIYWLEKTLAVVAVAPAGNRIGPIARSTVSHIRQQEWNEFVNGNVLWCPLLTARGEIYGGLWLTRSAPWKAGEEALLERLADAYAHAWRAIENQHHGIMHSGKKIFHGRYRLATLLALVLILMLPVRQSALAPAEVVPVDPVIVTSPLEGVIRAIHVEPNSLVTRGELLFSLDSTSISNQHAVALKAAEVAQAEYLLAAQKAFKDDQSKSELALLRSRISLREAEAQYSGELLAKVDIHAARDGIAIYTAANDWLGKPVKTGEKVMTLADPEQTEMQLWLAVDDAISLETGATVKIFLNIDPTHPLTGTLRQTSYEPQLTPDGNLAFQLKVGFDNPVTRPRIGLKGTGKIYGDRVPLIGYLLRRPFSALRRITGL
jgi:multidrug resistance efflux pump